MLITPLRCHKLKGATLLPGATAADVEGPSVSTTMIHDTLAGSVIVLVKPIICFEVYLVLRNPPRFSLPL